MSADADDGNGGGDRAHDAREGPACNAYLETTTIPKHLTTSLRKRLPPTWRLQHRKNKRRSVRQRKENPVEKTTSNGTGGSAGRSDWNRRSVQDAVVIFGVAVACYACAEYFSLFDVVSRLHTAHTGWAIDDVAVVCIVLSVALAVYAWRRLQDVTQEVQARRAAEAEVGTTIERLNDARRFLDAVRSE